MTIYIYIWRHHLKSYTGTSVCVCVVWCGVVCVHLICLGYCWILVDKNEAVVLLSCACIVNFLNVCLKAFPPLYHSP